MLIARQLAAQIMQARALFPAVVLTGPRQVGKTTLAKQIAGRLAGQSVYLDLERPADLLQLRDEERFFKDHQDELVILDEVQTRPDLFARLRWVIDNYRKPGRFLMLGSASGPLLHQTSESLAGRISYHELGPLLLTEVGDAVQERQRVWLRGGFPQSYLASTDESSVLWRDAFLRSYLERDLPQLGIRTPASQFRRFFTMLAHVQGQLLNASRLAASMDVSVPTVQHYLGILEDTFLIRRLRPYHVNLGKRLVKSPKIYIRDSGLLHLLLNIMDADQLQSHPALGESWEGFVLEQIIGNLPPFWEVYFYRTQTGVEIDVVLVPPGGRPPVAVEIKYSSSPNSSRGLHEAMRDLKCESGYIVCSCEEGFRLDDRLMVLPVERVRDVFGG